MSCYLIADKHNQGAATRYWPSDEGMALTSDMRSLTSLLQCNAAGGVTYTIEVTLEERKTRPMLSADVWNDVTKSCVDHVTDTKAASWVDTNTLLDISHLRGRFRIKEVTSDATNDSRYTLLVG